jgi:hypothetical protein
MAWLWDITRTEVVNTDMVSRIGIRNGNHGFEVVAVETIHIQGTDRHTVLAVTKHEAEAMEGVRAACRATSSPVGQPFTVPSTLHEWEAWMRHSGDDLF